MEINIRYKPLKNNRLRAYLDYYPPLPINGGTRQEFLKMFIYSDTEYKEEKYTTEGGKPAVRYSPLLDNNGNPKKVRLNALQKKHNEDTESVIKSVHAQRVLQVQAADYGFLTQDKNADFLAFFKKMADKRKDEKGDHNFLSTYSYLCKYCGSYCPANMVTIDFCEGFRDFLQQVKPIATTKTKLSEGAIYSYFAIFRQVIAEAAKPKNKILKENVCLHVEGFSKPKGTHRKYLTMEEIELLIKTDCRHPELKRAALLSVMTGLRHSDIEKLTWSEIVKSADNTGYSIKYYPEKTQRPEFMPISEEALNLMGERGTDSDTVFNNIKYSSWLNTVLSDWGRDAGINKHITFHQFRHTYATLQITLGTDIYTVSKMMGHRNINTTQIYAQVVDQKKRAAANAITLPTLKTI